MGCVEVYKEVDDKGRDGTSEEKSPFKYYFLRHSHWSILKMCLVVLYFKFSLFIATSRAFFDVED